MCAECAPRGLDWRGRRDKKYPCAACGCCSQFGQRWTELQAICGCLACVGENCACCARDDNAWCENGYCCAFSPYGQLALLEDE